MKFEDIAIRVIAISVFAYIIGFLWVAAAGCVWLGLRILGVL